ncbi:hypothetical protein HanPI659440_Chr06g0239131 [Helianthus annuus]|nr:hypothetical protein HanPI659440_Chr06g0239131 [Helianthus annuus]
MGSFCYSGRNPEFGSSMTDSLYVFFSHSSLRHFTNPKKNKVAAYLVSPPPRSSVPQDHDIVDAPPKILNNQKSLSILHNLLPISSIKHMFWLGRPSDVSSDQRPSGCHRKSLTSPMMTALVPDGRY